MGFAESNPGMLRSPEGVPVPDRLTFSVNPDAWLLAHWGELLATAVVIATVAFVLWRLLPLMARLRFLPLGDAKPRVD